MNAGALGLDIVISIPVNEFVYVIKEFSNNMVNVICFELVIS